jgi:metal-dependent amidase/aminoacylase/carboxypeptidase family protein
LLASWILHVTLKSGAIYSYAHDLLTSFMSKQGFEVTKKYLLETAWSAVFTHGQGGRTIGINSEMDALPSIGHACGHNLIAIAGVAVAVGIKAAMEKWDIPGKIILLGTPGDIVCSYSV